eukprot:5518150-Amphidinium_carterae.1
MPTPRKDLSSHSSIRRRQIRSMPWNRRRDILKEDVGQGSLGSIPRKDWSRYVHRMAKPMP